MEISSKFTFTPSTWAVNKLNANPGLNSMRQDPWEGRDNFCHGSQYNSQAKKKGFINCTLINRFKQGKAEGLVTGMGTRERKKKGT